MTFYRRHDLLAILPNETYQSVDVDRCIELTGSKRLRVDSWVKTNTVHTVPMTFLRAYRGYGPPTADFKLEQSSMLLIEKLAGVQSASTSPPARVAQGTDDAYTQTAPSTYEVAPEWRPATSGTIAHASPVGHSSRTPTSYAARTPTYGTMTRSGSSRDLQADVFCSGDYALCACDRCFLTRWLYRQDMERLGGRKTTDSRCRGGSRLLPSLQATWRVLWRTAVILTVAGALWGAGYGTYRLGKIVVEWVLRVSHSISLGFANCVAAAQAVWKLCSRVVGNVGSVLMRAKAGMSWAVERVMVLVKSLRRLGHWTR